MDYETALQKAKDLVTSAKEIVIVTHTNPTMDSMGGSLALLLGLVSLGKKATVVCPDAMTVGLSSFVSADKVVRDFGRKNFVVSLDYVDGSVEKVSYNIEGKKFNLVVEHRPGFEPMTSDKVQYSYQGISADLIISVDTLTLATLGSAYEQHKDLFTTKQIINIDFHNQNVNYGAINLVDPGASSTSELVAEFLATLGVKLTTDIATNLLNSIYDATNNFQNANVTSMAFEVASVCLKAGAKRFAYMNNGQAKGSPAASTTIPVSQTTSSEPIMSASPAQSTSQVATQPIGEPIKTSVQPEVPQEKKSEQPPSDWLKPKIFKSSSLL